MKDVALQNHWISFAGWRPSRDFGGVTTFWAQNLDVLPGNMVTSNPFLAGKVWALSTGVVLAPIV